MLCQLSDLKERLKIQDADVVDDVLLESIIAGISGRFEREANRKFAYAAAATYEFRADEMDIVVDRYPIVSVASFELKSNETDGYQGQTGVDFAINHTRNIIELAAALGTSRQFGLVTFAGGYVLPGGTVGAGQTALPDELEQAAIEQCVYAYQNKDRLGLASISGSGGSIAKDAQSVVTPITLLPQVLAVVRKYERWLA